MYVHTLTKCQDISARLSHWQIHTNLLRMDASSHRITLIYWDLAMQHSCLVGKKGGLL